MDMEKYNAIREGAQKRKQERESNMLNENAPDHEMVSFDSVDELMEAIRKES